MNRLRWPSSLSLNGSLRTRFDELAESVLHGDERDENDAPATHLTTGDGRVVYDISNVTSIPAVLKVAHNQVGVDETRFEVHERARFPQPLQSHLVPVLDHGSDCAWGIQPKCDTSLPVGARYEYEEELATAVEEAGYDPREVIAHNIGLWDGEPVLFDYGGL